MKIKFGFDSQFIGCYEQVIDVSNEITKENIILLYEKEMGLPFNADCYYEIMEE